MHSTLIPGLPVQTFGLCVAIGVYLAWIVAERLSLRKDIGSLICILALAGIAGARAAHVVEYWREEAFAAKPLSVFAVWNGGLVFYGGLVAAGIAFCVWCRAKKLNLPEMADLVAVTIPLAHACGRVGCFFHGCCWGKVTTSAFGVTFPAGSPPYFAHHASRTAARSLPLVPVQLIESAALLCLFALLLWVYRRKKAWTAALYTTGYAVIRFFTEFLRDDTRPEFSGFSSAQLFSIVLAAAGAALFVISLKANEKRHDNNR